MKRTLALVLTLLPSLAWGQGAVLQNGPVTKFDIPGYVENRIVSAGPKIFTDNSRGFNLSHFFDNHGPGVCSEDALTSGAYHQICIGHDANGNAVVTVNNNNGAAAADLRFSINGTNYTFPFSGGGILGPITSTVDNIATWNGLTGGLLKDSGVSAVGGKLNATGGLVSSNEQQAYIQLSSTTTDTVPKYGILGIANTKPASGSPWSFTSEGVIGLAYHQSAGVQSGFVIGVGGTGFLCGSSGPACAPSTVANSTGFIEGIYGSAENNGAGNAAWLIGIHADGQANVLRNGGTATNNAAIYVTVPTVGTNRYGIYFPDTIQPLNGSIAAALNLYTTAGNTGGVYTFNRGTACGVKQFSDAGSGYVQGTGSHTSNTCNLTVQADSGASVAIASPTQITTSLTLGSATPLTLTTGELGLIKVANSGTAAGATGAKLAVVCGTNAGSAKIIARAGTSTTAVTVLDNIGAGVTGC